MVQGSRFKEFKVPSSRFQVQGSRFKVDSKKYELSGNFG
jgi:hypothetical protein